MNKKYYTTKYKAKADCIMFLSGENYMIFDDTNQTVQFINSNQIYKSNKVPDGLNLFIKAF